MKKIILYISVLLILNQILYLTKVQYICTDKINNNQELNYYEKVSALQTHSMLWLIGWIVEPNTAQMCFCKQFHISNPIWLFNIPEDYVVKQAKLKNTKVRLTWKSYTSKASIYLNGSYIEPYEQDGYKGYLYEIHSDYKPGIINICGINISETVFDYLENKNILASYIYMRIN